ncbi:MAG TPA: glucose 1-dehydrogenase [Caldilineaceae bacterium]|nr:glucose 1-dehydrogenase [Caldilineaceae bacterium]
MPNYDLTGQVAIITGGGSGIGRAVALRFAREGCRVTVADINTDNAAAVAAEVEAMGGEALSIQIDVTRKDECEHMVQATVNRFGRLNIQFNNAGIARVATLLETDEATWDAIMNVNAKGILLSAQAAARQMIAQGNGGRIINNASAAGKMAPGRIPLGAYSASKHAVVGLTRQMGLEWAQHGILVNCVCPGIVDTPMWELIDREVAKREGVPIGSVKAQVAATIPIGRIEQPEDVANMVAFLASADAAYVTAQAVDVSGGRIPY